MSGDRDRVAAFALLLAGSDVPLVLLEALPPTGWSLGVGLLLALASWTVSGTYAFAAARATSLRTRGWVDGPWAVATLGIPVGLVLLGPLVPGRSLSPWTPMAGIGATILLGIFWAAYLQGGGVWAGPAPFRYGLRSLALEDRAMVAALVLAPVAGVGALAVLGPVPEGLFLAVGVGGLFGGYVVAMWWMGRRRREGWARLARGLGWEETGGHRAPLDGRHRGREAKVGTVRDRARWLTFWTTDARLELDPVPDLELHVRREGRLGRLQRALGARDAQLGRDRWDDRFLVGTDDEEAAEALFRAVGDRLLEARGDVKALLLEDGDLVAAHPGVVTDPSRIRRTLNLLDRMAEVLEDHAREGDEDDLF